MKKMIFAAVIVAMMFAGCGVPGEIRDEPEATISETQPATEPAAPFKQGQAVFVVYQSDGILGMRRLFVVTVVEDVVIVTTAVPGSGEEGELLSFPVVNCYADEAEARKVSGMEPME